MGFGGPLCIVCCEGFSCKQKLFLSPDFSEGPGFTSFSTSTFGRNCSQEVVLGNLKLSQSLNFTL